MIIIIIIIVIFIVIIFIVVVVIIIIIVFILVITIVIFVIAIFIELIRTLDTCPQPTAWSAWSSCVNGTRSKTRQVSALGNDGRCKLTIETISQRCGEKCKSIVDSNQNRKYAARETTEHLG